MSFLCLFLHFITFNNNNWGLLTISRSFDCLKVVHTYVSSKKFRKVDVSCLQLKLGWNTTQKSIKFNNNDLCVCVYVGTFLSWNYTRKKKDRKFLSNVRLKGRLFCFNITTFKKWAHIWLFYVTRWIEINWIYFTHLKNQ